MLNLRRVGPGPTITALAFALLLAALALAPPAEAFIYWTNSYSTQNSIGRANLDGTGLNPSFIPVGTADAVPVNLTLDAQHVYWAAACFSDPPSPCSTGAIGHANLDATDVEQGLIGGINPGDVAVDAEHVYWTWSDCSGGWGVSGSLCTTDELADPPGGIARANLDGSGVDQNFIRGVDASSVAVDAKHIYWTGQVCEPRCSETVTGAIGRATLDGTGVDRSFVRVLPSGFSRVGLTGLAVNAAHIYWTGQAFSSVGLNGPTLGRANLDGSGVNGAFIGGQLGSFHMPFWTGVAVDDAHLYWTEYGSLGEESILRASLDGGEEVLINGAADDYFSPGALAVDALTDTQLAGKVSAAKSQRQSGNRIVVRVKVKAKERLAAKVTGKIKVNPTYKLKPKQLEFAAGETRTLKLKPKNGKAKRIAAALKRGKQATAAMTVKLTDQAGNTKTQRLRVKLKAQAPGQSDHGQTLRNRPSYSGAFRRYH